MADDELDDWKHLSCIIEVDLEYHDIYTILTMIILLLRNELKLEM